MGIRRVVFKLARTRSIIAPWGLALKVAFVLLINLTVKPGLLHDVFSSLVSPRQVINVFIESLNSSNNGQSVMRV